MKYVDTSAFLKLLISEAQSEEMAAAVLDADLWSSTLLAVEAHRAAKRLGVPDAEVDELLTEVSLVLPAAATYFAAQSIGSAELRTLDALHLASALELGIDLEGVFTYDKRLAIAAETAGVAVLSPGLPDRWWSA
jgi:uncharacterized protein